MKKSSFKFTWEDTFLEMLPSRALFLPETKELLICDIHLGKAEYFQKNGIPLTNNSDENNFLFSCISFFNALLASISAELKYCIALLKSDCK